MTAISTHPPLTLALGALASLAAFALLLVLLPSPVFPRGAAVPQDEPAPSLSRADLDQPPLTAYAVITGRPLFNEGRKKDQAPVAVSAEGALPALSTYRLAGIVVSSQTRLALVEKIGSKQMVMLKIGDTLDGRRVDDVEDGAVIFATGGQTETLTIPHVAGWSRAGETPEANASLVIAK